MSRKVRSRCSLANAVSSEPIPASVWSTGWWPEWLTSTRGNRRVAPRSRAILHSFTELGDEAVRNGEKAFLDRFVPELGRRMQSRSRATSKTTIPASRGQPLGAPTGAPNTGGNRLGRNSISVTAARAYFSTK